MDPGSSDIGAALLPRVVFTREHQDEYQQVARDVLRETLLSYEDFIYTHRGEVDKKRWKSLKEQDNVAVYRERSSEAGKAPSHPPLSSSRAVEIGPMAAMAANSAEPAMLVVGTTQGTLDEAMYGSYVDDTVSFRCRSVYEQDNMSDCLVYPPILSATQDDPFRFLGTAWMLFPGLGAILRKRDLFNLLASGFATTSNGERVGYSISHSVTHPQFPEFEHACIRGKLSLCVLYRQLDDSTLDIYAKVIMDSLNTPMSFFVLQDAASALLAIGRSVDCAHSKKMLWFIRSKLKSLSQLSPTHSSSSSSSVSSMQQQQRDAALSTDPSTASCTMCAKSLGALFSSGGHLCHLCDKVRSLVQQRLSVFVLMAMHARVQVFCSRCSVKKKLIVDASSTPVVQRNFHFCIPCTMTMTSHSTLQVQRDEVQSKRLAQAQQQLQAASISR